MKRDEELTVEMIPIENVHVVNPRSRGQHKFRQIVANIGKLGLKKPITVSRRDGRNGHTQYDLVCGQGRLEAYRLLGQAEVPAVVVEVSRENLMLMSLAENLARKRYTTVELAKQIMGMKDRGLSFAEIAEKADLHLEYVRGIVRLLNKGEEHLLRAVEGGQIPITIAITIASADDQAVQRALAEAYESKSLRGKSLLKARQLIELRRTYGKSGRAIIGHDESMSADKLVRTFQLELNKQRVLVKKAKLSETRLLFIVTAVKSLFADENFVNLLRAEGLSTVPQYLADHLN